MATKSKTDEAGSESSAPTTPVPKQSGKKTHDWPLKVTGVSGKEYEFEKGTLLRCISKHRVTRISGSDHRRYEVPRNALVPSKLFPKWERMPNPRPFIPFAGNLEAYKAEVAKAGDQPYIVLPGESATANRV